MTICCSMGRRSDVSYVASRTARVMRSFALAMMSGVGASVWAGEAQPGPDPYYLRSNPITITLDEITEMHITSLGKVTERRVPSEELGICPVTKTHTDANFEGGSFVVQAGFAEDETAAAQYTFVATDFPLQFVNAEIIFATSNTTVQTVTEWSVLIWSGNPQTGQLVDQFFSDDKIIPHLRINPGTNGVRIS